MAGRSFPRQFRGGVAIFVVLAAAAGSRATRATERAATSAGAASNLEIDKFDSQLMLSWDPDCGLGNEYGIYRGDLALGYGSIAMDACDVVGGTAVIPMGPVDHEFFLVVPTWNGQEGSYGRTTSGIRAPAASACHPAGPIDPCALGLAPGTFVVPFEGDPFPASRAVDAARAPAVIDAYVLVDRSGSLQDERSSISSNFESLMNDVVCPPLGNGDPESCIQDLWSGAGTIGYDDVQPYSHLLDLQVSQETTGSQLGTVTTLSTGSLDETIYLALSSASNGLGSASNGCGIAAAYPDRGSCAGSPAGAAGHGYPCFRPVTTPVIVVLTDEPPSQTFVCPGEAATVAAAQAAGARIVGLIGNSPNPSQVRSDLEQLAVGTGAVDAGGVPLVFDAPGTQAGPALQEAILTLGTIPRALSVQLIDDPEDAVDAVAEFIDHVETVQLGTAQCRDGLVTTDSDGDGFHDTFVAVPPGDSVCWLVIPKMNLTVPPGPMEQTFGVTVEFLEEGATTLGTSELFFVVPP